MYPWVASTFCFIIHNADVDMSVQRSVQIPALGPFQCTALEWNARLYGDSVFTFGRTTKLFSTTTVAFYLPASNAGGFQFLHILADIFIMAVPVGMMC